MKKTHQRILQLHTLLSKLLDSLTFELSVNRPDENSISLLQIVLWRRKGEIDELEFLELYRSWLEAKGIYDIVAVRQSALYGKEEVVGVDVVRESFMNVNQILNDAYNRLYKQKRPNNIAQLQQAQHSPGYIHLRLSSIFFFTAATLLLDRYTIPLNYESFKIHMNDLRREMCEQNGMVSLRGFKNYLLNLSSGRRVNYLENLMGVFGEIEGAVSGNGVGGGNCLPGVFDEVFGKWRNFPRFNLHENKKNLEIYRRVFEENQRVFFDQGATIQYFLDKYGEEFVKCFQIDGALLREFNVLLKQSLNKYIQIFSKISMKLYGKTQKPNHNSSMMTHRKKDLDPQQQLKLTHKGSSNRQKTPTKSHRLLQTKNPTRTPTKTPTHTNTHTNESKLRKQFGSADKSKQKIMINRTLTPTRQLTPTKSSSRQTVLHQSQAYTYTAGQNQGGHGHGQKSAIKVGVEKDSFYNKMVFFRNKRVESYEIVMKRLRGK